MADTTGNSTVQSGESPSSVRNIPESSISQERGTSEESKTAREISEDLFSRLHRDYGEVFQLSTEIHLKQKLAEKDMDSLRKYMAFQLRGVRIGTLEMQKEAQEFLDKKMRF